MMPGDWFEHMAQAWAVREQENVEFVWWVDTFCTVIGKLIHQNVCFFYLPLLKVYLSHFGKQTNVELENPKEKPKLIRPSVNPFIKLFYCDFKH